MTAQTATSDWRHKAACLDEDPELFFPIGVTYSEDIARTAEAKAICGRCVSREACLTWALEHRADYGIFGGLTEDERWSLRRQQKPQAEMRDDSRAPYLWEDVHDLMRTGIPYSQWPGRLGTTPKALVRRLDRHGRRDLARLVERATNCRKGAGR